MLRNVAALIRFRDHVAAEVICLVRCRSIRICGLYEPIQGVGLVASCISSRIGVGYLIAVRIVLRTSDATERTGASFPFAIESTTFAALTFPRW